MYRSAMLIIVALVLVACGGATTPAATRTTVVPAAVTASVQPARDSIYAALPQSVTADGYYVLGNENAPAVMTHYSDLL